MTPHGGHPTYRSRSPRETIGLKPYNQPRFHVLKMLRISFILSLEVHFHYFLYMVFIPFDKSTHGDNTKLPNFWIKLHHDVRFYSALTNNYKKIYCIYLCQVFQFQNTLILICHCMRTVFFRYNSWNNFAWNINTI